MAPQQPCQEIRRKIGEDERKRVAKLTKKFLAGMAAGTPTHSFCAEDFAEPFLAGAYNAHVHAIVSAALAGE